MKIGVFSKFDMAGGSEFRCVELCNGISKYTSHQSFLLSEKAVPQRLYSYIKPEVNIVENALLTPDSFYDLDSLIIVNTDSKEFSTVDYWEGKSHRHGFSIDLNRMKNKNFYFLYNFLVSPSRHLHSFSKYDINVNIITTNIKFYEEITKQDRYENVRLFPRYILNSPIDPDTVDTKIRKPSKKVCFGMHSKRSGSKWNDEMYKLIKEINLRYPDSIEFRFMGIKKELSSKLKKIKNVTCLNENEETVKEFLNKLDVFLFFPSWKREEPWARVIAESMVSGCPVIALNKGGTKDQVLQGNNGFLCKKYDNYLKAIICLMEHKDIISKMSKNSIKISKDFYTEKVIKKLINILEA